MKKQFGRWARTGAAALVLGGLVIGSVAGAASAAGPDRFGPPGSGSAGQGLGSGRAAPQQPGAGRGWDNSQQPSRGMGRHQGIVAEKPDAAEVAALQEALDEEYGALNTYKAVMAQLGDIYPFNRIARSEQQHVNALVRLFTKYGLEVPSNPGLTTTPTWASVAAACATGVAAEKADAALYDRLEPQVDNADILRVFANLQRASLESHLPAFEACD